jgi:phage-related minor tail protein
VANRIGTAYVEVTGDLSPLNKALTAFIGGRNARLGKLGKKAGLAVTAGLAAGVGAAAVGKGLFDLGKSFDAQFDKIRVGTGKTGAALGDLQGQFKNVLKTTPASFDEVGDAITGVNQRLGLTGKPLANLARQFTQLSRITKTDIGENISSVAKSFRDWQVATEDQSKTLDGFFRISQKSGVPVSQLATLVQKFGSPCASWDSASARRRRCSPTSSGQA